MWCDFILLVAQKQERFWRVRTPLWFTLLPSGKRSSRWIFLGAQCGTCERRGSQDNSDRCAIAFRGASDAYASFRRVFVRVMFWGPR